MDLELGLDHVRAVPFSSVHSMANVTCVILQQQQQPQANGPPCEPITTNNKQQQTGGNNKQQHHQQQQRLDRSTNNTQSCCVQVAPFEKERKIIVSEHDTRKSALHRVRSFITRETNTTQHNTTTQQTYAEGRSSWILPIVSHRKANSIETKNHRGEYICPIIILFRLMCIHILSFIHSCLPYSFAFLSFLIQDFQSLSPPILFLQNEQEKKLFRSFVDLYIYNSSSSSNNNSNNTMAAEEEQKVTSSSSSSYFDAKYLDPKYPIVKADPTVDDVVKGMRGSDYLFCSGVVAGTYAYGFLLGKPVRGPTAVMCASAGFTFAMFHTMQTVRSRLLGYRENDREVKKYGLAPVPQPKAYTVYDKRNPVRQSMLTKAPLDWDKY